MKENQIFICSAEKDIEFVNTIKKKLNPNYEVIFNLDLHDEANNLELISNGILESPYFIGVISNEFIQTKLSVLEMKMAILNNIQSFIVFTDDVKLTPGLSMLLLEAKKIKKGDYQTVDELLTQLEKYIPNLQSSKIADEKVNSVQEASLATEVIISNDMADNENQPANTDSDKELAAKKEVAPAEKNDEEASPHIILKQTHFADEQLNNNKAENSFDNFINTADAKEILAKMDELEKSNELSKLATLCTKAISKFQDIDIFEKFIGIYQKHSESFGNLQYIFEQIKQSAAMGDSIQMYKLGLCNENGFLCEKNQKIAVNWYRNCASMGNEQGMIKYAENLLKDPSIGDENQAFMWLNHCVQNGNAAAMLRLGEFYEQGIGCNKNINEALKYYQLAAQHNNVHALYKLGTIYEEGTIIPKNVEIALDYFDQCTKKGLPEGMAKLASYYLRGEYVDRDPDKAYELLLKSAQNECVEAIYQLGMAFHQKLLDEVNELNAFFCFDLGAEKQHAKCMLMLGYYFEHGIECEKNIDSAFHWYKQSAEAGNVNAMCNLGIFYESGLGSQINDNEAFKWYQKAAEYGHQRAMFRLANCYKNGRGCNVNGSEAIRLYKECANRGNVKAINNLGLCYALGIGGSTNNQLAFQCFNKAAKSGLADAMKNVAICYMNGAGCERSEDTAKLWFMNAFQAGNRESAYVLAYIYLTDAQNGDYGARVDGYDDAKRWFIKAKNSGLDPKYAQNCINKVSNWFEIL